MQIVRYLYGFGNYHQTEAIKDALPITQNSPQKCPLNLYAEQISGSAFTKPRHQNLKSWLYRILPSVMDPDYKLYKNSEKSKILFADYQEPNPFRWSPQPELFHDIDFIDGLLFISGNQHANTFIYQCNQSMNNRVLSNNDGEFLFIPYCGAISIFSEFGKLTVKPGSIAVIPRGIKFRITLIDNTAYGYLCENKTTPFTLPQLGVIGANGLANPRHFLYPHAAYEVSHEPMELICKYQQQLWTTQINYSPLNVVAWQGNYAPYSYDLALFNCINTVSFDHPDPSIFTVLTSESAVIGLPNLDFVIFPERWMVAEHTFRPPYFHKNCMSELMGLIFGEYDAKKDGFLPGGISIHNCMVAHGPDSDSYLKAMQENLQPHQYQNNLAFMLESSEPWNIGQYAAKHKTKQPEYKKCWQNLQDHFSALNI